MGSKSLKMSSPMTAGSVWFIGNGFAKQAPKGDNNNNSLNNGQECIKIITGLKVFTGYCFQVCRLGNTFVVDLRVILLGARTASNKREQTDYCPGKCMVKFTPNKAKMNSKGVWFDR